MKKFLLTKSLQLTTFMVLAFTFINVNTLCSCTGHQPKVPACAQRFKK